MGKIGYTCISWLRTMFLCLSGVSVSYCILPAMHSPAQLMHSSCTAPALLLHCSCRGDGISHSKSMQSGNQISIKSCWDVQSMSQCLDPPEMCQAQRGHRKVSSWHAVLLCSLAVHCNKLLRNFLWQPVPPVHNITDRSELEETLNIF